MSIESYAKIFRKEKNNKKTGPEGPASLTGRICVNITQDPMALTEKKHSVILHINDYNYYATTFCVLINYRYLI